MALSGLTCHGETSFVLGLRMSRLVFPRKPGGWRLDSVSSGEASMDTAPRRSHMRPLPDTAAAGIKPIQLQLHSPVMRQHLAVDICASGMFLLGAHQQDRQRGEAGV